MKKKYRLKPWVKTFLLLLPELIIILQLFIVCNYLKEIRTEKPYINVYTLTSGGTHA